MPSKAQIANTENAVIQVNNISKCYQIFDKPAHRLLQVFSDRKYHKDFWALNNIDLTIEKGETVGIVGKNGSGKSTLLQIITGILQPTTGSVVTKGRISALLELGAGFNPEFTGLENARLNASIMGLSREEFHQKLPDITEFCGLGDFLTRPVKTYSSGMYVRLAFAVAINMNPDILIIDEALAVGDIRFQRKCFRRLQELKNQGVSILFVTHSTDSVINHCDRAILLNEGDLVKEGSPKDVVQDYLELMFSSDIEQSNDNVKAADITSDKLKSGEDFCIKQKSYNANEHRWGDGRAKIVNYQILREDKAIGFNCLSGDKLTIKCTVYFEQDIDDLIYGLTVKTADGGAVYGTNSRLSGDINTSQKKGDIVELEYTLDMHLLSGDYFISLGVAQDHDDKDNVAIDRRYDLIHIRVEDDNTAFGLAALNANITQLQNSR